MRNREEMRCWCLVLFALYLTAIKAEGETSAYAVSLNNEQLDFVQRTILTKILKRGTLPWCRLLRW